MKKLSLKDAISVAKQDVRVGVYFAIKKLGELGFDTSYYWDTMNDYWQDPDEDDMNLKTRDELFRRLGITEIMERAYTIVCN